MKMRVEKNEAGRWEVAFSCTRNGEDVYAFEPDSPTFATKREAEEQMRHYQKEDAADRAAQRTYQYQYAYACGERD